MKVILSLLAIVGVCTGSDLLDYNISIKFNSLQFPILAQVANPYSPIEFEKLLEIIEKNPDIFIGKNRAVVMKINEDVFEAVELAAKLKNNISIELPKDEGKLFLLKSLLSLQTAEESLLNKVDDALCPYSDFFCKKDPYYESINKLRHVGSQDCNKLLTFDKLEDLTIVLAFSKAANEKDYFTEWGDALNGIIEGTLETSTNKELLSLFKELAIRVLE